MRVPEEALKHEKFSSQLQFSPKLSDPERPKHSKVSGNKVPEMTAETHNKAVDALKAEDKTTGDLSVMPRGTPLYGQPAWWGDEDAEEENPNKQDGKESGASGYTKDPKKDGEQSSNTKEESLYTFCREPSYFEIPTKEFPQQTEVEETAIHEAPTKDTHCSHVLGSGHASFTIEFDDNMPGKVTIKDHVTKFAPDRYKSKKPSPSGAKELSGLHTEMLAAESKVADWLAQNNPPRLMREAAEEDAKSIKSDVPVYLKRLKGNKHEDGTQSDYENSGTQRRFNKSTNLEEHLRHRHIEQKKLDQKLQASGKHQESTSVHRSKHEDGGQNHYENGGAQKRINKSANLDHLRHTEQKALDEKLQTAEKHQETACQTAFLIEFFDDDHPRKRRSYSFTQNAGGVGPEAPYPIPQSRLEKVKGVSGDPKGLQSGSSSHRILHSTQHAKLLLKQKSEEPCATLLFSQNVLLRSSGSLGHRPNQRRMMAEDMGVPSYSGRNGEGDQRGEGAYTIDVDHSNTEEAEKRKIIEKEGNASSGGTRWVSQWASLASNHIGHDQEKERPESDGIAAVENDPDISESGMSVRSSSSTTSVTSQNDRKRRTLPQVPKEEANPEASRYKASHQRSCVGEKQDTELQEKEASNGVSVNEKSYVLDAKGATKTGKSVTCNSLKVEGDATGYSHLSSYDISAKGKEDVFLSSSKKQVVSKSSQHDQKEKSQWTSGKSSSSSKQMPVQPNKTKDDSPKSHKSSENMSNHKTNKEDVKGKSGDTSKKESAKPLVRQGSFTIDKPSMNVPLELIPRINKQTVSSPTFAFTSANKIRERSDSADTDSSMDTTLLLKDTEAVMAFLEAKLRDESKTDEGPETPSYTQENSISPESDVDTASTISLVTGDAERKCTQKRKNYNSLYKEKSSTSSPSKDLPKTSTPINREKLEKKPKTRVSEAGTKTDTRKVLQTSGRIRQPSLDLTDDDQTSSLPHSAISDILSSDQETYNGKSVTRSQFTSADELLHSKSSKSKSTAPTPSKSVTLPRPRPTRTSLLRRSRLGEASDTEVGDADKASVASEVSTTSSTSKPPSGKKSLSRIDLLAQPRRTRLGSISARSDSEATISRSPGSSRGQESVLRSGLKTSSGTDGKGLPRARANSISRLSDTKTKTITSTHSSPPDNFQLPEPDPDVESCSVSSRWRRIPPEYASTSEDEFGSNRNSPKHARLRTSPAVKSQRLQTTGTTPVIPPTSASLHALTFKHRVKEQEDYIRDWTAHREEIARISQDLALIAREINDVAGEIDSVTSSGTAPSTTVSTAATTPGSAIDTREEVGDLHEEVHKLVDRVFDESLNFRKIPPSNHARTAEVTNRTIDAKPPLIETPQPHPQAITRRKTWSRDEVMGDSLLLSSVFQFSRKIRQAIDKTANKIRILFKDKERNWGEIENKLRAESEIPLLKTSCVEILSILQELKRVEKQLQVINVMIDPDGTLETLSTLGFNSSMSSTQPKQKQHIQTHTTRPTVTCQTETRGGRPNISVASEFDHIESETDFSIQFNRFNPDGEEEDSTLRE
ncbi:centrosomal protein of 170 kDa isoform X1 [Bombina bombina]|nr:centrosomal protein of 170 kDa isoform X1 [Bombina bombina]